MLELLASCDGNRRHAKVVLSVQQRQSRVERPAAVDDAVNNGELIGDATSLAAGSPIRPKH